MVYGWTVYGLRNQETGLGQGRCWLLVGNDDLRNQETVLGFRFS